MNLDQARPVNNSVIKYLSTKVIHVKIQNTSPHLAGLLAGWLQPFTELTAINFYNLIRS